MKIRQPKTELSAWQPESTQSSLTYRIKTITPIYGGGVEAGIVDTEMPVRAAAIRGQLRFWWRFLRSHDPLAPLGGEALFNAERAIWGGMSTNKKDQHDKALPTAGKVKMVISEIRGIHKHPCGEYIAKEKHGAVPGRVRWSFEFHHGIPPYCLFSAQGKPPSDRSADVVPAEGPGDILKQGLEFTLELFLRMEPGSSDRRLIEDTVRWWANFGGIGSRTRRGMGAVEVKGLTPLSSVEVDAYGCQLETLSPNNNPEQAWKTAVERLYQFRQGRGCGRRQGKGQRPGQSYWPEADSIRDYTGNTANGRHQPDASTKKCRPGFPRAMFGLPIIFDFQGAEDEPKKHQLTPHKKASSRMASPLIVKPVADGSGSYIPTALLLPTDHLNDLAVELKELEGKRRSWGSFDRQGREAWWPTDVKEQKDRAAHIEPMREYSHDPLQAFLKFFAKGKHNGR